MKVLAVQAERPPSRTLQRKPRPRQGWIEFHLAELDKILKIL